MNQSITVPLVAKTPLWTGTTPKKMEFLKATSFLGGLRFWTEALLRSLGHHVCAEQERCLHDPDQNNEACSLCSIFGCTGLSRGFVLKIHDANKLKFLQSRTIKFQHRTYTKIIKKQGREKKTENTPKFYLKPGIEESFAFDLAISPLRPGVNMDSVLLALHLMIHWGSMGAQDQYGYGYVVPIDATAGEKLKKRVATIALAQQSPAAAPTDRATRPDLRDFFFFRGQVKPESDPTFTEIFWNTDCPYPRSVPFELRCRVREMLRDNNKKKDLKIKGRRHQFCGSVGGDQFGSRYNMGLIGDIIYGWGWYPRAESNNSDRNACINAVRTKLDEVCTNSKWKEFESTRDTCHSSSDWGGFFKQLQDKPWR